MADEDILARLLESERASNELVREAQTEADRRVKEATEAGEAAFAKGWEESAKALEEEFRSNREAVLASFNAEVEAYDRSLQALGQDRSALRAVVMEYLERGA